MRSRGKEMGFKWWGLTLEDSCREKTHRREPPLFVSLAPPLLWPCCIRTLLVTHSPIRKPWSTAGEIWRWSPAQQEQLTDQSAQSSRKDYHFVRAIGRDAHLVLSWERHTNLFNRTFPAGVGTKIQTKPNYFCKLWLQAMNKAQRERDNSFCPDRSV